MSGWIKLYREITEHWIFQDAEKFKWWIDLLIMASHEDYKTLSKGNLIDLKRGQLLVSLSFLSARWGRSKEKVLNFLKLLESDNMILRNSDRKSTTITICNYESYQFTPTATPTTEPTNNRPMSDQCPTKYKNVEECKEILDINTNAHTREEKISFDSEREQGFFNTFKGTGVGVSVARATGKNANEIFQLLDIFMAECQIRESGHKDFQDFKEHFLNAIKGDYISLPAQPQPSQPKKKVITNEDLYKEMYG